MDNELPSIEELSSAPLPSDTLTLETRVDMEHLLLAGAESPADSFGMMNVNDPEHAKAMAKQAELNASRSADTVKPPKKG